MAAGGVDPPHGAAHVVEGQAEAFETVGAEVLPGDGLLRPVPRGGDPTGAGTAERAIAVVHKQRCLLAFHQSNRNASSPVTAPWYALVVLRLTRPSVEDLTHMLAKAKAADLSYPEASATRDSPLPAGYRLDRYVRQLSSDETVFERAVEALRGWKAHVGAGVEVVPDDARVTVGATVLLLIKTFGFGAAAPCRVVYAADEPTRFSFAYAPLPGH